MKVYFIGQPNLDLFILLNKKTESTLKDSLNHNLGEKIATENKLFLGGNSLNAFATFSKNITNLDNIDINYISHKPGPLTLNLINYNFDIQKFTFLNSATSFSSSSVNIDKINTVLHSTNGERTILSSKSRVFTKSNLDEIINLFAIHKHKALFYISSLNATSKNLTSFIKKLDLLGHLVVLNPSKIQLQTDIVSKTLKHTSLLAINKQEAKILANQLHPEKNSLLNQLSSQDLLKVLSSKVSNLIITNGKFGSVASVSSSFYKSKINSKIRALDRTGAGDAFLAGFLVAYLKKIPIQKSLELANSNSESVIKQYGAQTGIKKIV
jgi:sugar/nucleoside kinase (ribokinase family)